MIPTAYKWELSSLLSYPLGAKNISDALAGVPQFDALSIRFSPDQDNPHRAESPFLVLRVNYRNSVPGRSASNNMIEEGWYDPKWEISVGAVPRTLRHSVKTALLTEALPKVRQWLLNNADATGREGHSWVRVRYDADQERLTYETSSRLR
ncbi:hypothetical protein B1759_16535 [Rubrivirga sp. SAORIC476]|uniref:hypothetical protein n=1 Tax=Rubrivirga sp. SAORIC476 TaxID=1961794 RepID=UPI000BC4645B|nr:hypothetical protein [Rubrivirga sp. SAORIC476]PAP74901.1 hypothetical protein B1759_16535 [Rubrivirga sp. SAORIC476]